MLNTAYGKIFIRREAPERGKKNLFTVLKNFFIASSSFTRKIHPRWANLLLLIITKAKYLR